jgi:hypothetical protein
MNDPRMMAMLAAQQDEPEAVDNADEDMLEQVRMGMGNQGGPPPGSGMRWENLEEDQQALIADPSPENVQAFVQYWGEDKLPPEVASQVEFAGERPGPGPAGGEY